MCAKNRIIETTQQYFEQFECVRMNGIESDCYI